MSCDRDYIEIKQGIERVRRILREGVDPIDDTAEAVPYAQNDALYQSSIDAAKTQLGADFSENENPLLYYPSDGNVVLTGKISSLNNANFQFSYKGNDGCYLWVESLKLTDDVVSKISKINGFYKNWRQELEMMGDIKPMGLQNED